MPELPPDPDGSPDGGELNPSTPNPPPRAAPDDDWRARALKAERELTDAQQALAQSTQERDAARTELAATRQRLDAAILLHQADAIDLTEALAQLPTDGASPAAAVASLRDSQPALFATIPSATNLPFTRNPNPADALRDDARTSGDRRILLRYLRARRGM